jgi:hypothetical protein
MVKVKIYRAVEKVGKGEAVFLYRDEVYPLRVLLEK